ncbi:hypothetical protein RvY_01447 [Ramazzottius varieornatus]|uniref:Uncharacterized protein n=1 Tax=Ramazzottius varieornatus TaxID=947166 RepID=A0A1D1URL5_RAMVA|nr:hypothetical protein RvY_01447 [Ramazzottius varieornatus]
MNRGSEPAPSLLQVDSRIPVTRTQFSPSVTKFVSAKLSDQLPAHDQAAVPPPRPAQSNMSNRQIHMGPRFDFFHGLERHGAASREME